MLGKGKRMNTKSIKLVILLMLMSIITVLASCGHSVAKQERISESMNSMTVCSDNAGRVYETEWQNIQITPKYIPISDSFQMNGDYIYFIDNSGVSCSIIFTKGIF